MSDELKIDARTGDEIPGLIPKGTYQGIFEGFGDIRESRTREDIWFLQVRMVVLDQPLYGFVAGYKPALELLKQAEPFYKGKSYTVKVNVQIYPGSWKLGQKYNTMFIEWQHDK